MNQRNTNSNRGYLSLDELREAGYTLHGGSAVFEDPSDHIDPTEEDEDMNTNTNDTNTTAIRGVISNVGETSRDLDATVNIPTYDVGEDVFDVIEALPTSAQRVAYRALAHTGLARAMYSVAFLLGAEDSLDAESLDRVALQIGRFTDLGTWASEQARLYARVDALGVPSKFDLAMSPADLFDFMAQGEVRVYDRSEKVFEASLRSSNLSPEIEAEVRAKRAQRLRNQAERRQNDMLDNRETILDRVIDGQADDFRAELFSAREHMSFFEKVVEKLTKERTNALSRIGDFDDAASDAEFLLDAIRRVDKASSAFRQRNKNELLTTQDLRASA